MLYKKRFQIESRKKIEETVSQILNIGVIVTIFIQDSDEIVLLNKLKLIESERKKRTLNTDIVPTIDVSESVIASGVLSDTRRKDIAVTRYDDCLCT